MERSQSWSPLTPVMASERHNHRPRSGSARGCRMESPIAPSAAPVGAAPALRRFRAEAEPTEHALRLRCGARSWPTSWLLIRGRRGMDAARGPTGHRPARAWSHCHRADAQPSRGADRAAGGRRIHRRGGGSRAACRLRGGRCPTALNSLVARRLTGEPLAWITGSVSFCGVEIASIRSLCSPLAERAAGASRRRAPAEHRDRHRSLHRKRCSGQDVDQQPPRRPRGGLRHR